MIGNIFNNQYKITKQIGQGAFSEVFLGIDLKTEEEIALKIEKMTSESQYLLYEAKLMRLFNQGEGFPHIIWYGEEQGYNIIVMEILGPSLEDLFNFCNRKFSLKTVIMVADQIFNRIEYLHNNNFIFRDLKPENFLVGLGKKADMIYIIDFGLCKKFRDQRTGLHIPYEESNEIAGTTRYVSINTHLGIQQSRRDDLEAIGYMLVYFLQGRLPWQDIKSQSQQKQYSTISEVKVATPFHVLCEGLPKQFIDYMSYVKNLKFEEKPDYMFIKRMFKDLFYQAETHWNYVYDWVHQSIKNEEKEKNKDE